MRRINAPEESMTEGVISPAVSNSVSAQMTL